MSTQTTTTTSAKPDVVVLRGEPGRRVRRTPWGSRLARILVYAVLVVMVAGVLLPLLWMALSGLKSYVEVFQSPWSVPAAPDWSNFAKAWNSIFPYIGNSVFVTLLSLAINLVVACGAAYALSFLRMPGTGALSLVVIGGMMLAPPVAMVPLFSLFRDLGLLDNLVALSVLYAAYRLPMSVFIIRAYMLTLPRELGEAASVDGTNSLQTLWHIVVPICKPAIISAGIMHLLFAWNEFPFALTLISTQSQQTLPVGLLNLQSDISVNWPLVFAAMTLAALPMVIVYLSAQRQFVRGAADGSIK